MNKEELEEKHEESERKEFIKKIIISIVCAIIGSVVSILLINRNSETMYPIHRAVLLFLSYWFVVLHFCIPLSDMYGFITKHRYKLAAVMLVFLTLMQYTTSSSCVYPIFTYEEEKNNAILGSGISYLFTDYAVEEPLAASQAHNNYGRFNSMIGGRDTDLDALVHAPVKNIFIIAKLYNVGYLVLGPNMGLAFETAFKALFLLLASYEFLMMLTDNKKSYAIIGSFVLLTSVAVRIDAALIIACVETILVLFNKFMLEENFKKKVLYVLGMSLALLTFVFTFYLPYIVTFSYFMIAAIIWIILKNRKEYKFKLIDLLLILGGLLIVSVFVIAFYFTSEETIKYLFNTVYPGQGDTYRANGIPLLFSYLYNYLVSVKPEINGLLYGGIFSLFPLPILLAFYYAFYKDKHQEFFMPMIIYATFIIVATVSKFPDIINRITFFKYVYQVEASVAAGFVGFILMFYYIANVQESVFKVKGRIRFLVLLLIIISIIPYPPYVRDHKLQLSVFASVFCWCGYAFLTSEKKEYRGALLFCLVAISIPGLFLKPVSIGMHGITDLDISHKIEEISMQDKDAKWITLSDTPVGMATFIAANGGTCLNAMPFYQGEEFYKTVLGEEKANDTKDIWNRYAHVSIELNKDVGVDINENSEEFFTLRIDNEAVKKLNVKYILTYMEESELEKEGYKVTKVYEKLNDDETTIDNIAYKGIYIYELN